MKTRVAVIGAGNGGQAMAGHLGMRGYDVSLLEDPRFEAGIAEVRSRKAIELKGALSGLGPVSATTDPGEAMKGVRIAYFVVPSFGQMPLFSLGAGAAGDPGSRCSSSTIIPFPPPRASCG